MKSHITKSFRISISFLVIILLFNSCQNHSERTFATKSKDPPKVEIKKLEKVIFYIENSESIFGYISYLTDYIKVVSELSEKPEFAAAQTPRDFYFINGDNLIITPIGTRPADLREKLNINGYNCGNITRSNLNEMFHVALDKAKLGSISILISDGIYDIGTAVSPLTTLAIKSTETRSRFIERLKEDNSNIQTLMIKLNSGFNGRYFFSSKSGSQLINHKRPYYIWIFGESELLNKYFTEKYISENLKGYEEMVRFFRNDQINIPYQATTNNWIGTFGFDKINKNKLIKAKQDRNGRGFQFDIAVDFSTLPLPDSYKTSIENYSCTGNFHVIGVKKYGIKLFGITFSPTHLITVYTKSSPYGLLEINLKNVIPSWINETNANDESNIPGDSTHTFGFQYLTDGIIKAYNFIAEEQNIKTIASFKIEILKKK